MPLFALTLVNLITSLFKLVFSETNGYFFDLRETRVISSGDF
jgi:hypothetical protein